MTEYQTISVIVAAVSAFGSIVSAAAATVAAVGIWVGIKAMNRANEARAAQAAADRKAMQEQAAADRKAMQEQAAADRKAMQEQAAEGRKVTQAMLETLESQGAALEELIRRTAPPRSGPAG